jgi:putative membrane protein
MRKLIIASMTMAAVLGLTIPAQSQSQRQDQTTQKTQRDTSFITQAAQANLAEIELGKLGAKKAQNDQIKQFSQQMQTDHQAAYQKLQPIAQAKGLQLSRNVDAKHRDELRQLRKLSGAEFDRQFAAMELRDHAETIALFQREAQQGQDPATQQYAQTTLPTLQHHLDMAKDVAKNVGMNETAISSILRQYPEAIGGTGTGTDQGQGSGSSQSDHQKRMHRQDTQK